MLVDLVGQAFFPPTLGLQDLTTEPGDQIFNPLDVFLDVLFIQLRMDDKDRFIQRHLYHTPLWLAPRLTWPAYAPQRIIDARQNQDLTLLLVTRVAVYDARQLSARHREALATSLTLQADLYAQLVNGSAPPPQRWDFLRMPPCPPFQGVDEADIGDGPWGRKFARPLVARV